MKGGIVESHKKIRRLASHVVDLIKAGEVIERPASVVKELFENAVDALADEVSVELLDGGRELIKVIDNGTGIPSSEISLALERHATSKLVVAEDLDSIASFGFRGEALASLAAVGRLTLRSRPPDQELGVEVEHDGQSETSRSEVAMNPGTTVALRELFASVPARRKFLKSSATEQAHVLDYLSSISLAYPAVGISLRHNGKVVFQVKKAQSLSDRLAQIYSDSKKEMVPFLFERGRVRIEGFAGKPQFARPSARIFVTFVNGRIVKDRFLRGGVLQAYSGLTIKGLSNSCVLYVSLDPAQVDVNAHPAKTEVRFWDPPVMQDFVTIALQGALKDAAAESLRQKTIAEDYGYSTRETPSAKPAAASKSHGLMSLSPARGAPSKSDSDGRMSLVTARDVAPALGSQKSGCELSHHEPRVATSQSASVARSGASFEPAQSVSLQANSIFEISGELQSGSVRQAPNRNNETLIKETQNDFSFGTYLGQFLNCYLIFQRSSDLLLVDQHAFHERILYEDLVVRNEPPVVQDLIAPILVPLTGSLCSMLRDHSAAFQKLGFEVEVLSSNEAALHGYPSFLNPSRAGALFEEVLARAISLSGLSQEDHHPIFEKARRCSGEFESLSPMERSMDSASAFHLIFATMACHGAVRSGDELSETQVRYLVRRSQGVDFFAHCPHGRPVTKVWNRREVEQWFQRI